MTGDVRVGVRPEKITLVPGGRGRARTARNVLRGQDRRRRVPRRLDPVRDPGRRRRGAQRVRAEHGAARSRTRSAVGREVQLAWKPGAHVRGGAWLSTRAPASSAAPARSRWPSSLAGCGIEGTLERASKAATPIPEITHPKVADRQLDVLQLAALHRQEGPQDLRQAATAGTSSTSRTSTTTTSSTARSASSCRPTSRSGATS